MAILGPLYFKISLTNFAKQKPDKDHGRGDSEFINQINCGTFQS